MAEENRRFLELQHGRVVRSETPPFRAKIPRSGIEPRAKNIPLCYAGLAHAFQSSLQQIFTMLKYRNRKKELYRYVNDHKEDLKRMDNVELTAALTLIGKQKRLLKIIREQKKEESKGQERINELNRCLLADDRQAELLKSVQDSAYPKKRPAPFSHSASFHNPPAFPVNKQIKQGHTDPSNRSTNGNGLETTALQQEISKSNADWNLHQSATEGNIQPSDTPVIALPGIVDS